MKVVILAGGPAPGPAVETEAGLMPMVEIGSRPILWHIMKHCSHFRLNEFYVALGHKGETIKDYFLNYHSLSRSITVNLNDGSTKYIDGHSEDWIVHLIDTGLNTQSGGRVGRLGRWMGRESFLMTYGDLLCDVNLSKLVNFHQLTGKLATIAAVRPPAGFGGLQLKGSDVARSAEKSPGEEGWRNGGFIVFEPAIFDYLKADETVLESDVLEKLSREGKLVAYPHNGFWHRMDTLREKSSLERLWAEGAAPWKVWS